MNDLIEDKSDTTAEQTNQSEGGNPLLMLGGFILLGIVMALFLFGGSLLEGLIGPAEAPLLQQVPEFGPPVESGLAVITEGQGQGPLQIGETAHDFFAPDLSGNVVALSDFRGQPVIINFWATWCPPCRVEMPELQAAYEAYQDEGLVILAVDFQESPETVSRFFYDQMGLTFTPLLDENGRIAQQYGVANFPTTYFVGPEGNVTAVHRGPMTRSQIDGYLAQTLPEA
jgi:cytochrome c biogenesis protein CcmG, thiol:disulfide interchange protein DsbE